MKKNQDIAESACSKKRREEEEISVPYVRFTHNDSLFKQIVVNAERERFIILVTQMNLRRDPMKKVTAHIAIADCEMNL